MAITTLTLVTTDLGEYSRYEAGKKVITVRVKGTPAQPLNTDELAIEIIKARRNRDVVVARLIYSFNGVFSTFDTTGITVSFNIPDILSSPDLIYMLHEGDYFIRVYWLGDPSITLDSADFVVSIMTIDFLKENYLFGLTLQASDVRGWRLSPRLITGVRLVEISRGHKLAMFQLTYTINSGGSSLSWAEGPLIKIEPGIRQTYILPAVLGQEYVMVEVDPFALPDESISEMLLVERAELSFEDLRGRIRLAKERIESSMLQIYLEPTRCVTDVDPTQITFSTQNMSPIVLDADFDEITPPVHFFPKTPGSWINIQLPMVQVLRVDALFGAVANTRVTDINLEWIEITEKGGFLQLVPFNQEIAFDYIGLVWVESMRGATEIPNFWHYNLIAGLRYIPGDILELLGREAAMAILTVAGQAYRRGLASQSISRDGVSESISYTASAMYGIYAASIADHRNWIELNLPAMKMKYRGLPWIVL